MNKMKAWISSPKAVLPCFCIAVLLLSGSAIGGARAAMVYSGENYPAQISTAALSVALVEESAGAAYKEYEAGSAKNGEEALAGLLNGIASGEEKIKPGKKYAERLGVKNTGGTAQYVRVTVYRYWTGKDQKTKVRTASPDYIDFDFAQESWEQDWTASTAERTVFYYTKPLQPGESAYFAEGLTIDERVLTEKEGDELVYGDLFFHVKVGVDAVQTHHAEDAALSAWGRAVTIDKDGTLGLGE